MLDRKIAFEGYQPPWASRPHQEWQSNLSLQRAAKLFSLAKRNSYGSPYWLDDWKLQTPLDVYFQGNRKSLDGYLDSNDHPFIGVPLSTNKLDHLTQEAEAVFHHPLAYPFFFRARQVYKQNIGEKAHKVAGFENVPSQVAAEMQLSPDIANELITGHKQLTTVFWDEAKRLAGVNSRIKSQPGEYEDWVSLAGERLSAAILLFYWEPMAIDPQATTQSFLSYFKAGFFDHAREKISVQEVPIAKRLNSLFPSLAENSPAEELIPPIAEAPRSKGPYFWNNLFQNIPMYQEVYLKRRMMLQPARRRWMDAFFEIQTGDRDSTLDILNELFPTASRDTLRRQINRSINMIVGKEKLGNTGADPKKGGPGKRYVEYVLFRDAFEHEEIRAQFDKRDQELIEKYYLADPEQEVTGTEVAKNLGIANSGVSRRLVWAKQRLERILQ